MPKNKKNTPPHSRNIKKLYACICLCLCTLVSSYTCAAPTNKAQSYALSPQIWTQKEQGLDIATLPLTNDKKKHIVALRFDPQFFDFETYTISENNGSPKTLTQWAKNHNLVAAINASMYLPDGSTSTGYLCKKGHANNKRIVERFGAFFLAQPKQEKLPNALLIDRDTQNWKNILNLYNTVVQNYRLISSTGKILWSTSERTHSIAAVGNDSKGRILFLHCTPPISAHDFAQTLLHHPINIHTVMYVEGGVQAGLLLRTQKETLFWGGSHPAEIFTGNVSVALPNIIGVKRRKISHE